MDALGRLRLVYRYLALAVAWLLCGCGGDQKPQTLNELEQAIVKELGVDSVWCGKVIERSTACIVMRSDGGMDSVLADQSGDGFDWRRP